MQGKLTTFPQVVQDWFHNINWVHAAIGAGSFLVLAIGVALVIYKVKNTIDPITDTPIGSLTGEKHMEEVVIDREEEIMAISIVLL